MQIQGPKSKDVLVDLFGDSVLEIPYYSLRDYELQGMDVVVSRTGYTSEIGFEIYCRDASRNAETLWDLEAGEPHGLAVIGPCHIRRIEGCILAYGADMWLDTNPYEVDMGYEWMVDLGLACGVRKLGSCGDVVFVDESAEAVATLDAGWEWTFDAALRCGRVWRHKVERAVRPVAVVVVNEDAEHALEVAPVQD